MKFYWFESCKENFIQAKLKNLVKNSFDRNSKDVRIILDEIMYV